MTVKHSITKIHQYLINLPWFFPPKQKSDANFGIWGIKSNEKNSKTKQKTDKTQFRAPPPPMRCDAIRDRIRGTRDHRNVQMEGSRVGCQRPNRAQYASPNGNDRNQGMDVALQAAPNMAEITTSNYRRLAWPATSSLKTPSCFPHSSFFPFSFSGWNFLFCFFLEPN